MEFGHLPVMLEECAKGLNIHPDGIYLDGTAGSGGHSKAIADRLTNGRLYCLDRDPDAVKAATKKLSSNPNAVVIQGDFRNAKRLLDGKTEKIDGALLDLGVSSFQLDSPDRGFSYILDGPLDMRMSKSGVSAQDIIAVYGERELRDIIYTLGEEKYAASIAKKIVEARSLEPITSTGQLAQIVTSALPAAVRRKEKNPARKTFMGLRISVNDELEALKEGMSSIFEMLGSGGRLCVMTFHSLEDRMVKQFYNSLIQGCVCPSSFPVCVCGQKPKASLINKKPVTASEQEVLTNRRARSAKLRVLEKI